VSATWSSEELDLIGAARELRIAARCGDGTLRRWVPIWVVTVDNARARNLSPSASSGTIAEMDASSVPGLNDPFEKAIDEALNSLPHQLREAISNVEIVVEDEPPDGQPLLGLYRGVPLPRRTSSYSGALPDKISIFEGPITRLAAGDADRLHREIKHVVLHEIAHHFGISDKRLIELDRY
jgi:predicted Zn-dependent protease with MMP-like domain